MAHLLNVWDGRDHKGNLVDNAVGTQGAVYVNGRLDAKVVASSAVCRLALEHDTA